MKALVTGLNGLVGSRVKDLLKDKYEFENISRATGVDITNQEQVDQKISQSEASIIIHFAAKTDVDGCEKDKDLGQEGEAWKINVEGTRNVSEAALKTNKKIIYISTDFVFDGEIAEGEFYSEESAPNPVNWYANTKYEGEKIVSALTSPWIILRIAYPYRASFEKIDFFRAIKGRLENNQPIKGVTDHIFAPTFIDDVAHCLSTLIEKDATGIFHSTGAQLLSPYDAALEIADAFGLEKSLISKTTRAEFFLNRAPRPFRLALRNDKIKNLGIVMNGFKQGIEEIKKQHA